MSQMITLDSTSIEYTTAAAAANVSNLSEDELCLKERKWWCFLLSSIISLFVCLVIVLLWHFFGFLCCRWGFKGTFITKATNWARELSSVQTTAGVRLMVIALIFGIGSFIVYIIDVSTKRIESCVPFEESITQKFDLFFNVFFLFYFFIRFMAASEKLWFVLDMYTMVDYFTIPPAFMSVYLGRTWLGFRFTRALQLLSIPVILQYVPVTANSSCRTVIVTIFLSCGFVAAGTIHLLENSGDPMDFDNARSMPYWKCISTAFIVGYGFLDFETVFARAFLVLYYILLILIYLNIFVEMRFPNYRQNEINVEVESIRNRRRTG